MRLLHLRPYVDSFFAWVDEQRALYRDQRGYTRTALEYANNQREVLTSFFDDGRLVLTNNGAERALKTVALGRNYAEQWIMSRTGPPVRWDAL